jgi:hypothetical protein
VKPVTVTSAGSISDITSRRPKSASSSNLTAGNRALDSAGSLPPMAQCAQDQSKPQCRSSESRGAGDESRRMLFLRILQHFPVFPSTSSALVTQARNDIPMRTAMLLEILGDST